MRGGGGTVPVPCASHAACRIPLHGAGLAWGAVNPSPVQREIQAQRGVLCLQLHQAWGRGRQGTPHCLWFVVDWPWLVVLPVMTISPIGCDWLFHWLRLVVLLVVNGYSIGRDYSCCHAASTGMRIACRSSVGKQGPGRCCGPRRCLGTSSSPSPSTRPLKMRLLPVQ